MKKVTVNFIVDLLGLLNLMSLVFTGVIMKYILPPGSGGRGHGFRGGAGSAQVRELWTMTRHEWGDIHFFLSVLFVVLITVHIVLHWSWIKNYVKLNLGFSKKQNKQT
ncbi:MAG: DUF4405 domain-containing protein [Planctomycetota bacterium]|jgi:hypothetical protein